MGKGRQEKPVILRGAVVGLAGVGGILCLVFAALSQADLMDARAHAAVVATAPDAAQGVARSDELAVIEGSIAHTTPLLQDEFVAYVRTQRQGTSRGGLQDVVIEQRTQPLQIETRHGSVRIVNDDYTFDRHVFDWADVERQHAPPSFAEGGIDIAGFVRGSPIMAVGAPVPGAAAQFRARSIVLGPRDSYLANLEASMAVDRSTRNGAFLLAPFLLVLAYWQGRRLMQD